MDPALTGRLVLTGLWIDAGLVMAASAWNGGRALEILGDPFWAGILLGLAVDVGLAVALIGDRALHLAGRVEHWGRALRITTALMSLALNCAVAAYLGQWGLVVFHAFLPLLLILLSEYSQSSTLQFRDIAEEHAAGEQAERDATLAAERAAYEAEQRRLASERQREAERLEQVRLDRARERELADATHQREIADRREDRAHQAWEIAASMASATALGAAWRSRPRPRRVPVRRPTEPVVSCPTPVPVTDRLVSQARRFRAERESQGETTGRAVLQRKFNLTERAARELVRRLDETPLHAVGSDR